MDTETYPCFGERVPYFGPVVRGIALVCDLFKDGPPDRVGFEADALRSRPEAGELFGRRAALCWRRR